MMLTPASLLSQVATHWYPPHYLATAEEASNRLQFMSPRFAPMAQGANGTFYLTTGYTLQRAEVNKLGINLSFSKSGVEHKSQYFWTWNGGYNAPVSTPYKDDVTVSIVYSDIASFRVWHFPKSTYSATWCSSPKNKGTAARNDIICVASEDDVHELINALATLVVASGSDLYWPTGLKLGPVPEKEIKKHPEQSGCRVLSTEIGSPADQAGVKDDDILHAVNGKPCSDAGVFSGAAGEAISTKPDGGAIHLDVLRKGKPMPFDLHYPLLELDAAKIRAKTEEMTRRGIPAPAAAPAEAPAAGIHLGVSVRAVNEADVAPMGLSKARGIVLVAVEKGGLAEKMGMQEGDVILEVNNSEIGDVDLFSQSLKSGAAKQFKLSRKGQPHVVEIPQSL
jgi:hypothetical protein